MRHLHASEVADANGVDPMKLGLQDMQQRLALAAIGQCGSPFQSGMGDVKCNAGHVGGRCFPKTHQ